MVKKSSFISSSNTILSVLIVATLFLNNPVECKHHNGFTVDLIRHHQPQINSSTPTSSHFEWLANSFKRSLSRSAFFNHALSSNQSFDTPSMAVDSQLTGLGGEYVMEVYIGKPAVKIVAIADTGSDLTWTQCKPCTHCYKQKDPLFDTKKTSSYRKLSCNSQQCRDLPLKSTSCDKKKKCRYNMIYGDSSQSMGNLAVDTFSFAGKPIYFPNTAFGCGLYHNGPFNEKASGIIGLGGGKLSIVNQFSKVIRKKFSYCLVPIEKSVSSKISFGVDSIPKGSKLVSSTPLIKGKIDTFYFLTLTGVSVAGHVNVTSQKQDNAVNEEGNIIIDSGTTMTILPLKIYADLKTAIIRSIRGEKPSPDPTRTFDLCYKINGGGGGGGGGSSIDFPNLVFHFKGADVVIPASNSFVEVIRGLVCLSIVPTQDAVGIFGNLSQMDFLVEYDIENAMLSFLPTDCTKNTNYF